MTGRVGLALTLVGVVLGIAPGAVGAQAPPIPDPNFATTVLPRPCAYEGGDAYEAAFYEAEGWQGPEYERYPGGCQRMRFSYGPIVVKPGQNDTLIGDAWEPDRSLRNAEGYAGRSSAATSDGRIEGTSRASMLFVSA